MCLPKRVIEKMHQLFAKFLWSSTGGIKAKHWIEWKDLCYPTEEGAWDLDLYMMKTRPCLLSCGGPLELPLLLNGSSKCGSNIKKSYILSLLQILEHLLSGEI